MLRLGLGTLVSACAFNCWAQTPIPEEGSSRILICYWAQAIVAGVGKCDPPSTLVDAVFGACVKHEDQIRQQVLDDTSTGQPRWERSEIAEIAIRRIHERAGPQVQGWILDAQRSDQSICNAKN